MICNVVIGGLQEHQTPRDDGICPSLTAAMGMGGGQIPLLFEKIEDSNIKDMEKIMSDRQERIIVRFMPDKAIRCYDKQKKTPISEWQIQCPDNVADTVVTAAHGKVYMKENGFFEQALETLNNNDCKPGDTINAFNQSVDKSGCCPTITTRPEGKKIAILPVVEGENKMAKKYRIRKLTSKECYRLMGFTDKDYKAAAVNSNTQMYKQAGNAIVKQVLMAIFLQMGIQGKKKWNEMSVEERQNLVNSSLDFLGEKNGMR